MGVLSLISLTVIKSGFPNLLTKFLFENALLKLLIFICTTEKYQSYVALICQQFHSNCDVWIDAK